ncbi:hypothetical protein Pint_06723 [Pistacia integerrima]|uniref:Uncharacterized protein n=1 Tax=Pistacia integerrima TaxID=434235 RepID=A0ACC0XUN4_9ROSI|nr:hypothetical protein Pint_06723 [Pistacia integerrima]
MSATQHSCLVSIFGVPFAGLVMSKNQIKDEPHDGHTSSVSELSWNPNKDWVIASVAAGSMIQIWQTAESVSVANISNEERTEDKRCTLRVLEEE